MALRTTTSTGRRPLFFLFSICMLLVVVFTSLLMATNYGSSLKHLPTVQGIYEKMPFFNSSYLRLYAKTSCPSCPTPAPCPTSSQSTCKPGKSQPCPTSKPCPLRYTDFGYFKRELNRQLLDIHREMKISIESKKAPSTQALLKLEGIMEQLDKSYKASKIIEAEQPSYPNIDNQTLDVCPEKYLGEKKGYPFFERGWITTNCTNVKPLPSVITILLNTIEYPEPYEDKVNLVLRGIDQTYPGVQVYLAPKNEKIREICRRYPNVKAIDVNHTSRLTMGKVWNQLVAMVKTPYTLIGRDLVHFTWTARIRRQIRMITEIDYVGIVGGSYRNWTGHWRNGCRQTRKKNYVLEYQEGYHYSTRSCMFCDDLEGPFVAKTHILKTAEFGEKLPSEVVFEDFFLKVYDMGYLTMSCPDAMYFANDYYRDVKRNVRKVWQFFSAKWKFVRILLPDGIMHSFSCEDISYRCATKVTKYATMPACCLEEYGKAMKFLYDLCREHNIHFELDSGSVLGAVKMGGLMPYDVDGDISLLSNNFSILYSFQEYIRQKGFNLNAYSRPKWDANGTIIKSKKGYLMFHSPHIYTEVYGWPTLSGFLFLPAELRDPVYFTKVLVNGYWISSSFCPGLFARNRYGLDVLKHSQSWLQVGGMGSSWSRYKAGRFLGCKYPKFHACLDKFPADGNIAFQVPSRTEQTMNNLESTMITPTTAHDNT